MTGQGFQDLGLQATNGGGCACCSPISHATAAPATAAAESAAGVMSQRSSWWRG